MWNCWRKSRNTNNNNEAYNSKINKLLGVTHPNAQVLLCRLTDELNIAEVQLTWLKGGNPTRKDQRPSEYYESLMLRRVNLMEQFRKGELDATDYLKRMGAISFKADHEARRTQPPEKASTDGTTGKSRKGRGKSQSESNRRLEHAHDRLPPPPPTTHPMQHELHPRWSCGLMP